MFDEFRDDLRRRQAPASGDQPGAPDDADGQEEPPPRPARRGGGGAGGGRPPSMRRGGPNDDGGARGGLRRAVRRFWLTFLLLAALFIFGLLSFGLDLWTDAIWYSSVGYESVFWPRLGASVLLFAGGIVVAAVVLLGNLWLAGRLAPTGGGEGGAIRGFFERMSEAARNAERGRFGPGGFGPGDPFGRGPAGPRPVGPTVAEIPDLTPMATPILIALGLFAALLIAGGIASDWETILLWRNQVAFGWPDPVFGRDIGFFLFDLPFLRLVQGALNGLVLGALAIAFARYLASAVRGGEVFTTPVRVHLAVLGGLYLLSTAAGYQLDKFEFAYTANGVASGVSYTDEAARFLGRDVLTVISALTAAFLVGGAFTRWVVPLVMAVLIWFSASLVLGTLYPEAIQRFTVDPNPYQKEERYIGNNIAMTRLAFGLDGWETRDYKGDQALTAEKIADEAATFGNARLWDYRPLGDTLDQLQTVRQYYDFFDVDTDRYDIGGERRQVMLSARELALEKNPNAIGWLNERIIYTHGIGLAMVPVNEVVSNGEPRLFIRNLPPVSSDGAPVVTEPRIYFGERPTIDYVIVGAKQPEFDFPQGSQQAGGEQAIETRWSGTTGIRLDRTLERLLFALRFRDLNLLISDQVTNQSQLLFRRSLFDRLPRIAPFLRYDKDPYLVVTAEGRLVWIADAYTVSDRFPHAQSFFPTSFVRTGLDRAPFNYIRNSVKIVMDAYDGRMSFYVADPSDPLVQAYGGIFPGLFRPLDEMPADLLPHLRYPEELFNVQTAMYGRYHVENTLTFFQQQDLWTTPLGQGSEQSLPSEAYYVIMRMPGEADDEFLLLQPMVAQGRPNMIAWAAARNDDPHRGQVRVYRFPADTTIFGPAQIEAQIDADPVISAQITLWSQAGSTVIRGNLIVVPVQDSIIYLQPVYLQSTAAKFPQFQRIVVASPSEVVWAETLGDALRQLLEIEGGGPGPGPSPGPTPSPGPGPVPTPRPSPGPGTTPPAGDLQGLIDYANLHFELAQAALRDGDFARYGEEIRLVEEALRQLQLLVGVSPSPLPSAAPAP